MTAQEFSLRVRATCSRPIPPLSQGVTPARHAALYAIAEEDVSLAKIAEAHFDAVSILAEAGLAPEDDAIYAVWASEIPGQALHLSDSGAAMTVRGSKPFCSGGTLVDRALVTIGAPESMLVELDLRRSAAQVRFDPAVWQTEAFRLTQTGAVSFQDARVERIVGGTNFYLQRPGFWNGACGPAACWAGAAAGLLRFAMQSKRRDPHTTAHLAAMQSSVWAMQAVLTETGREIDAAPVETAAAQIRALRLRHIIEHLATDTLQRFARAYGPHPLAMDGVMSRRYAELGLFLRQCHGERDLESLGRALLQAGAGNLP